MSVLRLHGISKKYTQGGETFTVLDRIDFQVNPGEVVALVGPSGCGKSTMLHVCGLLDGADSGDLIINDIKVETNSDSETTKLRRELIGFVYQFHHLLPEFTAVENVALPLLINGFNKSEAISKAKDLLNDLSLSHRLKNLPSELSGGEQQRVAIARSLVHKPKLVLADEPTGNLDPEHSKIVFDELVKLARLHQMATVIVTHNLELAKKTDKIFTIRSAKLVPLNES